MSWKDNLMPATFRNVPFKVTSDEGTFGRRVQTHEYPNRDTPYTEDLGRATRKYSIDAYVIGDDYMAQRDKLLAAAEQAGAGTLMHPFYGEKSVCIEGEIRVSHSDQDGRMCHISLQFVEAGELSFPMAGAQPSQACLDACAALEDAISTDIAKKYGLEGTPGFLQDGVIAKATGMMKTVTSAFTYVNSRIADASRLLEGDLSVLLPPPSNGMNLVNSLQSMWRAGSSLTGNASDLFNSIKSLSGITMDRGLAPRGVWKTDSKTTQTQTEQSNVVAQAIRTTALSEAAYTVAQLPQPVISSGVNDSTLAPIQPVSHPSVLALNDGTIITPPLAYDALTDIRETLNTAIDLEQTRTQSDPVFLALTRLRAAVNSDISARLAQSEKTVIRTPEEVLPALVLAADWYDAAGRETDISLRNAIRHPGFVPVAALRVPVL